MNIKIAKHKNKELLHRCLKDFTAAGAPIVNFEKIGKEYNLSHQGLRNRIKNFNPKIYEEIKKKNIKLARKKMMEKLCLNLPIKTIVALRNSGATLKSIGDTYGCSYEIIRRKLLKHNEDTFTRVPHMGKIIL